MQAMGAGGETPLTIACSQGYRDVVKAMLDRGVSVNTSNEVGETALRLAARRGHPDIMGMLIARGAADELSPPELTWFVLPGK